jgi:hypothetical protein
VTVSRDVLHNSAGFDWTLQSESPEVRALVRELSTVVVKAVYQRSPSNMPKLWRHVEIVALNLFTAHMQDPNRWVGYPRERSYIDQKSEFEAGMFLDKVVEGLLREGLIEERRGKRGIGLVDPETGRNYRARMRATDQFGQLAEKHKIRMRMIRSSRNFGLIRLKDKKKKWINLPRRLRPKIAVMSENLRRINELLENSFIGLHVPDATLAAINERLASDSDKQVINFAQKRLYRVFNAGSLEQGGRFVGGWWQNVPKEYRPHIYIGGPKSGISKASAEVDFSSMFPAIAYALLGKVLDDTAYQILSLRTGSKELRSVVKQTLLTMLMAESRGAAIAAVHSERSKETVKQNPEKYPKQFAQLRKGKRIRLPNTECLPAGCPKIASVVAELERKHEVLRADFLYNPDKGRYLMYRESQIAERIMLGMLQLSAPALPIHDSFLAMGSYVGYAGEPYDLDIIMRESFKAELGVECRITFDIRESLKEAIANGTVGKFVEAVPIEELFDHFDRNRQEYKTFYRYQDDWYGEKTH